MFKPFFIKSLLLFLLLPACKNLEELPFFSVETDEQATFVALGQIVLRGRVDGLPAGASVAACGFLWSEDLEALQNAALRKAPAPNSAPVETLAAVAVPLGNGPFEAPFSVNLPAGRVFYCAFARLSDGGAERTMFSVVKTHDEGSLVGMVGQATVVNDSAHVSGFLALTLAPGAGVESHGFVFSTTETDPKIGRPNCQSLDLGPATGTVFFEKSLRELPLNTTFHLRAFVKTGTAERYSESVQTFQTRDGWKRIADFVPSEEGAFSANSAGDRAHFGFYRPAAPTGTAGDFSRKNWAFDPAAATQWTALEDNPDPNFQGYGTSTFVIGDTLYAVFGQSVTGAANRRFCKMHLPSGKWAYYGEWPEPDMFDRAQAVSFVLSGVGYVGTGVNGSFFLNDFWAYDPGTGAWRKVATFPGKPRNEAVVFVFEGVGAVVGGGWSNPAKHTDFWRFSPPTTALDSGRWEQVADFPGLLRIEAVAFSLGGKGYYGLGRAPGAGYPTDFWCYDPLRNEWTAREKFPLDGGRRAASATALGNFGYVTGGSWRKVNPAGPSFVDELLGDVWRYEPLK